MSRERRVAVTGASGHLGGNLVRELTGRGYEVVALVRKTSSALNGLDVERVQGDIFDSRSLEEAFEGVNHVYHLAAYISMQSGDKEKLEAVNVEGTRKVLQACWKAGVSTMVHFSSIHALDPRPLEQPMTEENPLLEPGDPHGNDYDHSKARSDRLIRHNDCESLSTRIIYPTAVFGPNDFNQSLFGQAIVKMATGRLPAMVAGGFDWVDARDVAWGAVEAAEKGVDGDRFILSGHYLEVSEVARTISEMTGVPAPGFTCPVWLARFFAPPMEAWARLRNEAPIYTRESLAALSSNKVMSHQKAVEALGYRPGAFRDTMRDTLSFYMQQKQIQAVNNGG